MNREDAMREAARMNGLDPADTRLQKASTPGFLDTLQASTLTAVLAPRASWCCVELTTG